MSSEHPPERWASSPLELIGQLCELQAEYARAVGYSVPRDCFCGQSFAWQTRGGWPHAPVGWENDGSAVRFIIDATREAIARLSHGEGI